MTNNKINNRSKITLLLFLVSIIGILPLLSCATNTDQTEETRKIADQFLHSMFVDNDIKNAYLRYAAPDFIQHNPEIADGIAGHQAFFAMKAKKSNGKTANWININNILLVDKDLFALHHHVFTHPADKGRIFVDIWRVADGRIVEHWDVIQTTPDHQAHSNGMACGKGDDYESALALGPTKDNPTCGKPDPKSSRASSIETLNNYVAMLIKGDVENSIRQWFSADYRQHSPTIADGIQGAIDYLLGEFGKGPESMPKQIGTTRIIAEGDYVLHHRQVRYPNQDHLSYNIDIFRITNNKISEHWDIKQLQPADSVNDNGMW